MAKKIAANAQAEQADDEREQRSETTSAQAMPPASAGQVGPIRVAAIATP